MSESRLDVVEAAMSMSLVELPRHLRLMCEAKA